MTTAPTAALPLCAHEVGDRVVRSDGVVLQIVRFGKGEVVLTAAHGEEYFAHPLAHMPLAPLNHN